MTSRDELEQLAANPLATEGQRQQAQELLNKMNADNRSDDTSLEKVRMDFKQHLLDIRDLKKVVPGMSAQQAEEKLHDLCHNWPGEDL
jgi:hypothetical protein